MAEERRGKERREPSWITRGRELRGSSVQEQRCGARCGKQSQVHRAVLRPRQRNANEAAQDSSWNELRFLCGKATGPGKQEQAFEGTITSLHSSLCPRKLPPSAIFQHPRRKLTLLLLP